MKINTQGHVENMNHSKLILQGLNAETPTEQEAKATKISKCHKDCQIITDLQLRGTSPTPLSQ